jgi:hypothetical protein
MKKYYKNSSIQDKSFTGLSVSEVTFNKDGKIFSGLFSNGKHNLGYQPEEITEEEYNAWKARIANPDNVTYFAGIFAGIGVIDKATRQALDAKIAEAKQAHNEKQVEANRINFKLAQRDAEAIGEDHEAVFTSKHPQVNEDVKAMLFTEVRAAQAKKGK